MLPLESGQVLCSRFTLLRPLGRGGMGQVWLASDRQLDEEVVTKIVPADASSVTIELLRHECRNTRRLSHPNIVRVFDFHQCDGVSFITMEHVTGESIETLRGASIEDIVQTLAWLAGALDHAHQSGVVHRDVKADNVLLDRTGQPRLMDFGIAAVLDPGDGDLHLEGGGSRYSMSPQQAAGDPPQPSDDIYGLGTLAYHLISGHPPFWSEGDVERIQRDAPEPFDPRRGVPSTLAGSGRPDVGRVDSRPSGTHGRGAKGSGGNQQRIVGGRDPGTGSSARRGSTHSSSQDRVSTPSGRSRLGRQVREQGPALEHRGGLFGARSAGPGRLSAAAGLGAAAQ